MLNQNFTFSFKFVLNETLKIFALAQRRKGIPNIGRKNEKGKGKMQLICGIYAQETAANKQMLYSFVCCL